MAAVTSAGSGSVGSGSVGSSSVTAVPNSRRGRIGLEAERASGRRLTALAVVSVLVVWQVLASTAFSGSLVLPSPTDIVRQFGRDGFSFYARNAMATLQSAALGYLIGNAIAVSLAVVALLVPFLERPFLQLGVASYCIPGVAIGPIFAIVFSGSTPRIALAGMAVVFTSLVGLLVGLRSATAASLDLVHVFGGGSMHKIVKVRAWAALPSFFAALRISAPAAVLGSILGEYLGADRGLGVTMIVAQQALKVERTWAITIVAALSASLAYAMVSVLARIVMPWQKGVRS